LAGGNFNSAYFSDRFIREPRLEQYRESLCRARRLIRRVQQTYVKNHLLVCLDGTRTEFDGQLPRIRVCLQNGRT
jgi:hypothetical protein